MMIGQVIRADDPEVKAATEKKKKKKGSDEDRRTWILATC